MRGQDWKRGDKSINTVTTGHFSMEGNNIIMQFTEIAHDLMYSENVYVCLQLGWSCFVLLVPPPLRWGRQTKPSKRGGATIALVHFIAIGGPWIESHFFSKTHPAFAKFQIEHTKNWFWCKKIISDTLNYSFKQAVYTEQNKARENQRETQKSQFL